MMSYLKNRWVIVGIIIAAVIGIASWYFFGSKKPEFELATAKIGNLTHEVSVTGNIKPVHNVDLAFERSGRVAAIYVAIGSKVVSGQVLAKLYSDDLQAELNKANATLKSQQAKFDQLVRGSRPEEIKVKEDTAASAQVALAEAKKGLVDKLNDGYTKSDDAVRNRTDQLFSSPRSANPQIIFTLSNAQLKSDAEWSRYTTESLLTSWEKSLTTLSVASDLDKFSGEGSANLSAVKSFLEKIALAVNSLNANATLTQTVIDGWRADIATARTNVNTASTNLLAAGEKLNTARSSLALAESELNLVRAGSTAEDIRSQEALVEAARADVQNILVSIDRTILRSSMDGVVTRQDAKVGEMVAANSILISVISEHNFEIEANIAEADIAKVKIGDPAKVTLDAYGGDEIFQAHVVKIDPAETVVEGVSTYKTTLQLESEDGRIKSGMTANIDILTASRNNVLLIPYRAVIGRNGDKIVRILKNGAAEETIVKLGLRGSDGNVEILEGISDGDQIIVFEK